jgi:serine/threonine-protein phosphatase 2A regulatory subunit B'
MQYGSRSSSPQRESFNEKKSLVKSKLRRHADAPKLESTDSEDGKSSQGGTKSRDRSRANSVDSTGSRGSRASTSEGGNNSKDASSGSRKKENPDKKSSKSRKKKDGETAEGDVATGARLADALPSERDALLLEKLQTCSVVYDFRVDTNAREKEVKRQTLLELVEHVNTPKNCFINNDSLMREAVCMVSANVFRALEFREKSPLDMLADMDDEDPFMDQAWPHLQLVYEFLMRFVGCKDLDTKVAAKFLNSNFITKLLALFDSDDTREREVLTTIMLKFYSRFANMRTVVRKALQFALLRAAHECEMPNGVSEMLELQVKVCSGFATPLKDAQIKVLTDVLLPLHRVAALFMFHKELIQCLMIFVQKDAKLCYHIFTTLLTLWPVSSGSKQVLFIDEMEELIKHLVPADFERLLPRLVPRLTNCITSPHSQVAERTLRLWDVASFVKLINANREFTFPPIISALYRNATQHWYGPVHGRTFDVLKAFMEADEALFSESSAKHRRSSEEGDDKDQRRFVTFVATHRSSYKGCSFGSRYPELF